MPEADPPKHSWRELDHYLIQMNNSLELTIEEFRKLDVREVCRKSGATIKENPEGPAPAIAIEYLGSKYSIRLPLPLPECLLSAEGLISADVEFISVKEKVDTGTKITLLHYLITSKGTPLTGKFADFREVPGGNFYYSTFIKLVHRPFLETFGEKADSFLSAGESMGGRPADFKDYSMKFPVLPNVPVTVVLYKGDEEFPPDCKFLFDSNIKDYLSAEGILKVCEELIHKLKNYTG